MDNTMTKKPKAMSKEDYFGEITEMDNRFIIKSLRRTNLVNIRAIHSLLIAAKRLLER
jgi:hypothetical protein